MICPSCLRPEATDALWSHTDGCVCAECRAHCWGACSTTGHALTVAQAYELGRADAAAGQPTRLAPEVATAR